MIKHATPDLPSPELRARVERLEAALKAVLQVAEGKFQGEDWQAIDIARAALAEGQMDVNSKEAELWSETMRLKSSVEHKDAEMDDILKTAWGDLLNENEKLAALLDEKDAEIERLTGSVSTLRELRERDSAERDRLLARIERLEAAQLWHYRNGLHRAATEVQIVCDRLDRAALGDELSEWIRGLPDDPAVPHPRSPLAGKEG